MCAPYPIRGMGSVYCTMACAGQDGSDPTESNNEGVELIPRGHTTNNSSTNSSTVVIGRQKKVINSTLKDIIIMMMVLSASLEDTLIILIPIL